MEPSFLLVSARVWPFGVIPFIHHDVNLLQALRMKEYTELQLFNLTTNQLVMVPQVTCCVGVWHFKLCGNMAPLWIFFKETIILSESCGRGNVCPLFSYIAPHLQFINVLSNLFSSFLLSLCFHRLGAVKLSSLALTRCHQLPLCLHYPFKLFSSENRHWSAHAYSSSPCSVLRELLLKCIPLQIIKYMSKDVVCNASN